MIGDNRMCAKLGGNNYCQKVIRVLLLCLAFAFVGISLVLNLKWLSSDISTRLTYESSFYSPDDIKGKKEEYVPSQNEANLIGSVMPIYIVQPSTTHSSILSWSTLASNWDRNSTFEDIVQLSNVSLLPPIPPNSRVVNIIHCSPKMASLTVRKACKDNLESSCGIYPKRRQGSAIFNLDPAGYSNIKEFANIIRIRCNETTHFCLRDGMFPKSIRRFDSTAFLHLYPFRNYDSWTVSAMKQEWVRGGRQGCKRLEGLMDTCTDQHGELSFNKYPKTKISKVRPLLLHRIDKMKEVHHVILYPFSEIHLLLGVLSNVYNLPLLPGSNGTENVRRKSGNCDQSVLNKFHECFTSKLKELPHKRAATKIHQWKRQRGLDRYRLPPGET